MHLCTRAVYPHGTIKLLYFYLQYEKIGRLLKDFEPYKNLWLTAADWSRWQESWMNDSLANIDPELMANNVQNAFKTMHKAVKHFKLVYERRGELRHWKKLVASTCNTNSLPSLLSLSLSLSSSFSSPFSLSLFQGYSWLLECCTGSQATD